MLQEKEKLMDGTGVDDERLYDQKKEVCKVLGYSTRKYVQKEMR
jgi:hypothetical protein